MALWHANRLVNGWLKTVKPDARRKALKWLVVGVGAGLAGASPSRSVHAVDGQAILAGTANTATEPTELTVATSANELEPGLVVKNVFSGSFEAAQDGIQGFAFGPTAGGQPEPAGIAGFNDVFEGIGAAGFADQGTGVFGNSGSGSGVAGVSSTGNGVFGQTSGNNVPAIFGSGLGSAIGVQGSSTSAFGIVGTSTNSSGLSGLSVNGEGILALNQNASKFALVVLSPNTTTNGAFIRGRQVVQGQKNAAMPTSKGLRALCSIEAPEALFEDFGRGQLVGGRARVEIDALFAEVIDRSEYFVFLTPRGDTNGLYVHAQDANGFEVREQQGGTSNVEFDYRIVGRRVDTSKQDRFVPIEVPDMESAADLLQQSHAALLNGLEASPSSQAGCIPAKAPSRRAARARSAAADC